MDSRSQKPTSLSDQLNILESSFSGFKNFLNKQKKLEVSQNTPPLSDEDVKTNLKEYFKFVEQDIQKSSLNIKKFRDSVYINKKVEEARGKQQTEITTLNAQGQNATPIGNLEDQVKKQLEQEALKEEQQLSSMQANLAKWRKAAELYLSSPKVSLSSSSLFNDPASSKNIDGNEAESFLSPNLATDSKIATSTAAVPLQDQTLSFPPKSVPNSPVSQNNETPAKLPSSSPGSQSNEASTQSASNSPVSQANETSTKSLSSSSQTLKDTLQTTNVPPEPSFYTEIVKKIQEINTEKKDVYSLEINNAQTNYSDIKVDVTHKKGNKHQFSIQENGDKYKVKGGEENTFKSMLELFKRTHPNDDPHVICANDDLRNKWINAISSTYNYSKDKVEKMVVFQDSPALKL